MGVGKKRIGLLHWLDVTIIMKSVLSALSLNILFLIKPEILPRQSPSCVRERSESAVDTDMYTWVSSGYK